MTASPAPAAAPPPPPPANARSGQPVGAPTSLAAGPPPSAGAPAPAPAGGVQGRLAAVTSSVRAAMAGTPGRLRAVGIVSVVAALLFGLAAGQAFRSADGALERAAANSDQLVRIQAIQTNVVQADADATNAFLVGGLEPPAQRADYTEAVTTASGLVAQAAQHQPADGNALAALNRSLISYTSAVEQARANNRQALPIGAQYLKSASADLRADALPLLGNLGEANNARVTEEFDAGRPGRAVARGGRAARPSPCWCSRSGGWPGAPTATSTSRWRPPPSSCWSTLVVGTVGLLSVRRRSTRPAPASTPPPWPPRRRGSPAFDAKSNESLTLIARGSGSAFEKAWQASSAAVTTEPASSTRTRRPRACDPLPWKAYADVHQEIRRLDDGGDWEKAVALADRVRPGVRQRAPSPPSTRRPTSSSTDRSTQTAEQLDGTGGVAALRRRARPAGRGWSPPCAPGGASRSGWRSTDEPPSAPRLRGPARGGRHPRRRRVPRPVPTTRPRCTPRRPRRPPRRPARPPPPRPRPRAPTSPRPTASQSYAPPAVMPRPAHMPAGSYDGHDPKARPAHRRRLGRLAAARGPQPGHRADRGLRHRHGPRRSRRRSSATRTRSSSR